MATEYGERMLDYADRVETTLARGQEHRGKLSSIHPGHFSCSKVVKLVSSFLLHRSAHYGSYNLIGSSTTAKPDFTTTRGRFGLVQSASQWNSVDSVQQGSDQSKSNSLPRSVSDDDLTAATYQRSARMQQEEIRRSLNLDGVSDCGLSKHTVFTSVDNFPFGIPAKSTHGCGEKVTAEVFELAERKEPEGSDSQVRVHNLRLANELGGILDPDDALLAVVDDKEQIVAIYDEQEPTTSNTAFPCVQRGLDGKTNGHYVDQSSGQCVHPSQPGGALAAHSSSLRTSKRNRTPERQNGVASTSAETNSVLVDEESPNTSNLLVVRRGSEPVLNAVTYADESSTAERNGGGTVKKRVEFLNAGHKHKQREDETAVSTENTKTDTGRFARTAARKSRLTDEWLEVAAQAAEEYRAKKIDSRDENGSKIVRIHVSPSQTYGTNPPWRLSREFKFDAEYEAQTFKALIVKRVPEPGGIWNEAIEGKLEVGDRIVELNGRSMTTMTFESAIDSLTRSLDSGLPVSLTVGRSSATRPTSLAYQPPSPVFPIRSGVGSPSTNSILKRDDQPSKSPASVAPLVALQKGNTRRIGQRINIDLNKKSPPDGFGFTLTSRDNEFSSSDAGVGETLVYVKSITPTGAAIEDGRLRAGDRLLEVNGTKLNKSFGQPEVVRLLRQLKPGDVINLVVSRQVDVAEEQRQSEKGVSPSLPRPLKEEIENEASDGRNMDNGSYEQEMLTFDIPLNNTGSAGLGVSVKGRMATDHGGERRDGGIFVKTIMHGGAGHKDGRLRVNDRVLSVEGVDLSGLSNEAAMQRLRSVLMGLQPTAKSIRLAVLRLVNSRKGEEVDEHGSTISDGGRHRLLVNENSAAINGNFTIHGDSDYAVVTKVSRGKPVSAVSSVVGQWPNSEDDEPPVMMEWSDTIAGGPHSMQASRSDSTGSSWTGDRLSRRDCDDEGSVEALFVRDAPTRRSMSEKRHGAAKNDPSSTATFQRIQHQRQTSAPSLQRKPLGQGAVKSSSSSAMQKTRKPGGSSPAGERLSMSLESVHCGGEQPTRIVVSNDRPLLHEEVAQSLHKTNKNTSAPAAGMKWLKAKSVAGRQRPTNDSFRHAVDKSFPNEAPDAPVDAYGSVDRAGYISPPSEPFYAQIPHSATADSIAVDRSRPVNKEKDRRKSTGSGLSLKNLFRFGSGGKANRPFAVVSPVNSELRADDEDEISGKKKKEVCERHKSQERAKRQYAASVLEGNKRIEKGKYHSNGHLKLGEEERQQLEAQEIAKRQHEEEQRRIRQHYERLKEEQLKLQRLSPVRITDSAGSKSPKSPYAIHPNAPHWKPPVAPISPNDSRLRMQSVAGRELAGQVQHGRQHSGGGSTTSAGSRLHSPAGNSQYYCRIEPRENHHRHLQPPTLATVAPQNFGHEYVDGQGQLQAVDNRRLGANNNPPVKPVSPVQSCWFVDGVGGASSVRRHRFYYSSMDGRPSERPVAAKHNFTPANSSDCHSTSRLASASRARCTSELVDNSLTENQCASWAPQATAGSAGRCTPNQLRRSNGHYPEQCQPRHPSSGLARVYSPEHRQSEQGRHHIIIGSIPIFDSRRTDGVTNIVIDGTGNGQRVQPAPPLQPPPDYEQYLRSRHARKGMAPKQSSRPASEFIGDTALGPPRYECASLPRKGTMKSNDDIDAVMATPPARDVHYFYHPN